MSADAVGGGGDGGGGGGGGKATELISHFIPAVNSPKAFMDTGKR